MGYGNTLGLGVFSRAEMLYSVFQNIFNFNIFIFKVGDELDAPPAKNTKDEEVEKQEASGVQLSTGLKKGTIKSHREAEITHFIKQFLKGKIEQKLYRQMVACLYFIYW